MRLLFFVFIAQLSFSQNNILVLGNYSHICFFDDSSYLAVQKLPEELSSFRSILIFSTSTSILSKKDALRIKSYVEVGGSLYLGAENWPLQAESIQLTNLLYSKELYGEYHEQRANVASKNSNLKMYETQEVSAGISTVAFPLDHRLKVEAWVNDQPLILSGEYEQGKVVIDGGYSRFYCENIEILSITLFSKINHYLNIKRQK
ncbi:MAG TPA: hypothetical protein EYG86_03055 [Crocinitomicaceae bacterium]|nr:hypothetical protein [Crocinitomicaceae bacterium]